uniref:Peptidase A1 domain-containing protein n=1 Tax=Mycena chlorophos TaxID=658473 RepID=A0ABQ0LFP1_MYCCL|nr:predicted protein [Mycena chlorophos]
MTAPSSTIKIYELGLVPWKNVGRLERMVSFVESHQVLRPDAKHWGIYYDTETQRARFFPHPDWKMEDPLDQTAYAPMDLDEFFSSKMGGLARYENPAVRDNVSPVASIGDERLKFVARFSGDGLQARATLGLQPSAQEINTQILALERRQYVDGLHYIRVAPSADSFTRVDCPRLLIDTGEVPKDQHGFSANRAQGVPWVHGPGATIIRGQDYGVDQDLPVQPEAPLRWSKLNPYLGSSQQIESQLADIVSFGDASKALLHLHRGDIHLASKWNKDQAKYGVFTVPDVAFGVATAVFDPRLPHQPEPRAEGESGPPYNRTPSDQIDGHLALAPSHRWPFNGGLGAQPDLLVDKLGDMSTNREELPSSGFTVALGLVPDRAKGSVSDNSAVMQSFISFGNVDDRSTGFPYALWSTWLPSDPGMPFFWAPRLVGAKIGRDGSMIDFERSTCPIVLDTGSEMSILPTDLVTEMDRALSCSRTNLDLYGLVEGTILTTALRDPSFMETITFYFDGGVAVEGPLRRFVDMRNFPKDLRPGYRAGVFETNHYLLGNMFFRGLLVDFQLMESAGGGAPAPHVRFAQRV